MAHNPDSLTLRLRNAWRRTGDNVVSASDRARGRGSHDKGTDFADRLRAAVGSHR